MPLLVAHRDGEHVVARQQLGDGAIGGIGPHRRVLADAIAQLEAGGLAQQTLHVGRPEQPAGRGLERRLAHEHLGGDRHHPIRIADLGEGVGHRRRGPEQDQLRGHHAARRSRLVGEQLAHDVGVVGVHRLEDARALLPTHLSEQVGDVVELHLVEDVDQPIEVEALDQVELLGLGQFLEHVGEALVVHRLGDLATTGERQGAHDVGDLGRVEVAEPRRFGGHLAARREQAGHGIEVDEPIARSAPQQVARDQAHLGDLPRRDAAGVDLAQADVGHGLVADLAVDHVLADEELAGHRLERVEVEVPAAQPGAVAAELGDAVGVDEDPSSLAPGDEADDAWRFARSTRDGDEVVHPADLGAARVEQGQAHHPERVDEFASHGLAHYDLILAFPGHAGRRAGALR